jgi:hypothetical protein
MGICMMAGVPIAELNSHPIMLDSFLILLPCPFPWREGGSLGRKNQDGKVKVSTISWEFHFLSLSSLSNLGSTLSPSSVVWIISSLAELDSQLNML